MTEENSNYTVLQLTKGAVLNECVRCGAVVFHRMIHDSWHATNDKFEKSTSNILQQLLSSVKYLYKISKKRTNDKSNQESSDRAESRRSEGAL